MTGVLALGSAKLVGQSIGCFGDSENRRKTDVGTNMAAAAATAAAAAAAASSRYPLGTPCAPLSRALANFKRDLRCPTPSDNTLPMTQNQSKSEKKEIALNFR